MKSNYKIDTPIKQRMSIYVHASDKQSWHRILKTTDMKSSQLFNAMLKAYQESGK
jgi:DNA-directed RNA polymerase subunit L